MSDRDQTRKQAQSVTDASMQARPRNVFDTSGNDAIKAKIAEVEAQTGLSAGAPSQQGLLQRVEASARESQPQAPDVQVATDAALKKEAVAARDEVILQIQQITTDADLLQQLQARESIGQASTAVLELVSQRLSDEDLAALAAYDHDDLMVGKVLSPESHLETRALSAQARKMGGFVPILWQLVTDQLARSGVSVGAADAEAVTPAVMGGAAAGGPDDPRALAAPLLRLVGVLSAARSSSIV